jgi:hypothetical protein
MGIICESSIWTRKLFLKYKSTWAFGKELAINFEMRLAFEKKGDEIFLKTMMMKLKEMKWMKHARNDEISFMRASRPKKVLQLSHR